MPEIAHPSGGFLTQKAGPLPMWAWALAGLGLAYAYSRYKANKAAAANTTTQATVSAGEPGDIPPAFVIENNLPQGWSSPAAPAPTPTPAPVSVTPPGVIANPPVSSAPPVLNQPAPTHPAPPVATKAPTPAPGRPQPRRYIVQHGDNLSSIARKFGVFSGNGNLLYQYNISPAAGRSPSDVATLKKRGAGLIYAGETIFIPPA